jgi:hypothetical protein
MQLQVAEGEVDLGHDYAAAPCKRLDRQIGRWRKG